MKTLSKLAIAALALLAPPTALAQEDGPPPQVGFIRIVNAVAPGEGNAKVSIDGDDILPRGYLLGQRTGGIGLTSGAHTIEVTKEGVQSGTTKISLATGETMTLIAFAERLPVEKFGDPPRWAIKILRLRQSDPERGFRMTLVSVCGKPEVRVQAAIGGKAAIETAVVKRLAVASIDLGRNRAEVMVKVDDTIVTTVSPEDPGNYVVVLYEDPDGKTQAISFFDPKFVIAG
jgi:hypothetical protein